MRSVFNVRACRVLGGLGDRLADWGLHFIGIGLSQLAIEIQIQERLIDTIKTLKISKRD